MPTGTPLATPTGLLLLDEAKEYAMPTQTFRSEFPFKSGSHRVDARESLSHPMPMPAPAGATAPSSPYQGTSWNQSRTASARCSRSSSRSEVDPSRTRPTSASRRQWQSDKVDYWVGVSQVTVNEASWSRFVSLGPCVQTGGERVQVSCELVRPLPLLVCHSAKLLHRPVRLS